MDLKKVFGKTVLDAVGFFTVYWIVIGITTLFYHGFSYSFLVPFSIGWALGRGIVTFYTEYKEEKKRVLNQPKSPQAYFRDLRKLKLSRINKLSKSQKN